MDWLGPESRACYAVVEILHVKRWVTGDRDI